MKRILSAIFALVLLLSSGQAALVNSISSLHQARPAMVPSAAHQGNPQAARYTADTYEFSIPDYQAIYWPDYDMLQVTMQETGGKWTFYFAFDGMHKLHPGLYTLPDMNPNYSFAQDTEGNWFRYTTASFTYTVDEEGVRRLDITVSDHTGHTYHITFSDPVRPTSFKDVYLTMNDVNLSAGFIRCHSRNKERVIPFPVTGLRPISNNPPNVKVTISAAIIPTAKE